MQFLYSIEQMIVIVFPILKVQVPEFIESLQQTKDHVQIRVYLFDEFLEET